MNRSINRAAAQLRGSTTMHRYIILVVMLMTWVLPGVSVSAETLIPRTMAGDKGRYYLLEKKKQGQTWLVVHKRVGVESVDFSRTEINCRTKQYKELGYSSESMEAIKPVSGAKWTELVPGSSKSDLVAFVCK